MMLGAGGDPILGVFLPMANGGWIVSETAPPVDGSYALNRRVAKAADRYGFDFILSMMKWRGYGGSTRHWDRSLEAITLMAGLAEATERVKIWATAHTILHNPAVVAKMVATLDHISNGRAGLNIVSGAYAGEFEQMGAWRGDLGHGERYDLADEWAQILLRLWTEDRVSFDGDYFKMIDCMSDPKPVSRPLPDLICAGTSEAGMRYTARHCDASFVHGATDDELASNAARAKAIGAEFDKDLKVFAMFTIVPGDTDAEAARRVELYRSGADAGAIATMRASYGRKPDGKESALVTRARDAFMTSIIAGTTASIAEQIDTTLRRGNLDGMMLIFPDYDADLDRFGQEVLPRLRTPQGVAA